MYCANDIVMSSSVLFMLSELSPLNAVTNTVSETCKGKQLATSYNEVQVMGQKT